ncbi:SGNH/GDSL hydrolase family protein [Pedobacter boryungensis]|uniref:SGNH/GDSL hydrolase family protein n=1 Tax=Pedobacter boryungensis TaxID=869962 RepID=A0ABX2DC77_9SPHI|nr:SGNH/GDSL hydrolase family protein [Pedobacter boryungensis]NQX31682.1 SGNH/GDSL hydrolase family protein [Pedobacter boryungensis]
MIKNIRKGFHNILFVTFFLFMFNNVKAQTTWYNPLKENYPVIQGQAQANSFQRLPDLMKDLVRQPVWALSQNTAGEYLEFTSNAKKIIVRYQVTGPLSMPHMPSTGVSGVDLFAHDDKGSWDWASGKYAFKDTVTYTFENLAEKRGKVFRLYFPLYNSVKWLEVGVDKSATLTFLPIDKQKPIVVYGTSIAQGGCASRPGLAWTSIFGRNVSTPVINLAFSGNGRLETPIIDHIAEIDAKLFILDCMPNLGSRTLYPEEEIRKRVNEAVTKFQQKYANTPILLVEHSGGGNNHLLDTQKNEEFETSSAIIAKIYKELKARGVKNIYFLTNKEIGMGINSTVDGAHPNDIGMMEHATAFTKKYWEIFKK